MIGWLALRTNTSDLGFASRAIFASNHYCPVKCSAPSLRSSIGAGCEPILFGADLNFVCPNPRTFPGLTASGSARVRWQDLVCSAHGIRAMDQLRANRATTWRQLGRSRAVLRRTVPCHGIRPVDMARELSLIHI